MSFKKKKTGKSHEELPDDGSEVMTPSAKRKLFSRLRDRGQKVEKLKTESRERCSSLECGIADFSMTSQISFSESTLFRQHKYMTKKRSFYRTHTKRKKHGLRKLEPSTMDTHRLIVELKKGEKLISCDSNGLSDPYVKFKLDDETVYKSHCCPNTLDPIWDETFSLSFDRQHQKLTVNVFDRDRGFRDDFMGCAVIDTKLLQDDEEQDIKLHLRDDKSGGGGGGIGGGSGSSSDCDNMGFLHLRLRLVVLSTDDMTSQFSGSTTSLTTSNICEQRQTIIEETPEHEVIVHHEDAVMTSSSIMQMKSSSSISPKNERRNSSMLMRQSSTTSLPFDLKKPTPTLRKRTDSKISKKSQHFGALAIATVCLVSGTDLPARDSNGFSDPYVKLQLGKQKRKSKTCYKTLNPIWKEEYVFTLESPETATLQMQVWDKDSLRRDDFIGQLECDVWSLDRDVTHRLSLNLVDTSGCLTLLVTIHDCDPEHRDLTSYDLQLLRKRYALSATMNKVEDVGFAEVHVIAAAGLKSADYCGKSDPFCVVKLCNAHAQTHTCYKTLDPVWNRNFTFPILDIHDAFEFLVYDADNLEGRDFLGRISIPILQVPNGRKQSYELKNLKLNGKAKGSLSIQINYIYNPIRAAVRTFQPREENLMQETGKFKKSELSGNFHRVWKMLQSFISAAHFFQSLFTWESPRRSFIAFLAFVMIIWNFELYMLPIALLLLFLKNYTDIYVRKTRLSPLEALEKASGPFGSEDEDDDDKQSIIQRINALQEILTKVQQVLDVIASFGERCHNAVTWSVPYLGWLAVICICLLTILLYIIPFRLILLLWGINKFTKKLRNPNHVDNNEILDYLSRVPSSVQLHQYKSFSSDHKLSSPGNSRKKKN